MGHKLYSAAQAQRLVEAEIERIKRDIAVTIDAMGAEHLDEELGLKGREPVITVMRLLSKLVEDKSRPVSVALERSLDAISDMADVLEEHGIAMPLSAAVVLDREDESCHAPDCGCDEC